MFYSGIIDKYRYIYISNTRKTLEHRTGTSFCICVSHHKIKPGLPGQIFVPKEIVNKE